MDYSKYYAITKREFQRYSDTDRLAQIDLSEVDDLDPLSNPNARILSEYQLNVRLVRVNSNGTSTVVDKSRELTARLILLEESNDFVFKMELSNKIDVYFLYFHL